MFYLNCNVSSNLLPLTCYVSYRGAGILPELSEHQIQMKDAEYKAINRVSND